MQLKDVLQHMQWPLASEQSEARRLFHGRGHAWPGLEHVCIDWFPPLLLITLYREESPHSLNALVALLRQHLPSCESIQVQYRYQRFGPLETLWGRAIAQLVAVEDGLKYQLSLGKNRNLGLFLDMRHGRQWVREHAQGKRVLNLFAYTCGFSVTAVAGGAQRVINIDMNSRALATGRDNHHLNNQQQADVAYAKLDIFKSWGRIRKKGPHELLICDPPTFQKGSVDIERDYPKILRRLDTFMSTDSQLMLCLNAPHLDKDYLLEAMQREAPNYRLAEELQPPAMFADARGAGLTVLCFERAG